MQPHLTSPASERPRSFRLLPKLVVLGGLVAIVFAGLGLFRQATPTVTLEPARPGIGRAGTEIKVKVAEPSRGVAAVRVDLEQNGEVTGLANLNFETRPFWAFWGAPTDDRELNVTVSRATQKNLREGTATIRATALGAAGLFGGGKEATTSVDLPVLLRPPTIGVVSSQHYAAQGGSGVVVYRVGESALAPGARDGVVAGSWFFPGYPLPGGNPGDRFAFYGVPYDWTDASGLKLVAADALGNEGQAAFVDQFIPRPMKTDTIELDDNFLNRVVPAILAETPALTDKGDLLENYLQINRDLRKSNNQELVALARESKPELLWRRTFQPMPNGQVMSAFADRRTYVYNGKAVDQQDHLGFDLASVKHAPVPAANDGVVVLARFFGIYGNTVVVDHGCGIASLYSHLSSISVAPGQSVSRGTELGRTGATGLAGGDHLHFTLLLHGLPVNPVEWWDTKWIQDRVATKLGGGWRFEG